MASFEACACDDCHSLSTRPQRRCWRCGSSAIRSVNLIGRGTLVSFTIIRVPPTVFQGQEPYHIAVIDLDEGLRITARLVVQEGREAAIDDPVIFEGMRSSYGPLFRLV